MQMQKTYSNYCVGCGLCISEGKARVETNSKGYYYITDGDISWLRSVCPFGGKQTALFSKSLWGRSQGIYLGWSLDRNVRQKASSGGALTEIAAYLLEQDIVDGIIHTCADDSDPTKTRSCISTTRDELIMRCGSRYAISHPLEIIKDLDRSKRYAFIGKPCDVDALTNFFDMDPNLRNTIVITMSFFCAGLPSFDAQEKLLHELGCKKGQCESLRYRGDGWPGYTTASDKSGNIYRMDYDTSWGKILGRDIMPMCRFCINGVGESADIACADGWHLLPDGKPDFSEHEGRNIIFARTDRGEEIIKAIAAGNKLHIETYNNAETELPLVQYFQAGRRQSMNAKKWAMILFLRPFPHYPSKLMRTYSKGASLFYKFGIFKGTIKRIITRSL